MERYVTDHPEDPAGWFLAARTARRRERVADAKQYLQRCQELGGVTDNTRLEWDLLRVQQGDTTGIDARLRETIGPDHPDALLVLEALARGYVRVERVADALQACDLWADRQPNHPWPFLWRGTIFERLNHFDRALEDYRQAVHNAPSDREARMALGGLLLRERQPVTAVEQFEAVLARAPDDLPAQINLAACRIEQGRVDEAVPLLDRALTRAPADRLAVFLRGKAALEQDQPAKAEGWLREAVRLVPHDPEALYQLSQALRALHKEEEAGAAALQADQLRTDFAHLDELIRAMARKPDDPKPRHEAGVLALRLGRTAEGLRWLHSVLGLKGDHRDTHAALADHYRQIGDPERSEYHRRLARTP